jgi:hypothetical protein
MTVYVVTQGEYSDYRIVGIYDNREAAENRLFNIIYSPTDEARVEEYDMGKSCKRESVMWGGVMLRDGTVHGGERSRPGSNECILYFPGGDYNVHMRGSSEPHIYFRLQAPMLEHAVKIVNEKRAEMVATDFWDHPRGERIGGWENGTGGHFRIKGKI